MRKLVVLALIFGLGGCSTFDFITGKPQVYAVFFPDHGTVLTDGGIKIVANVAADAKLHGAKTVQITGPSTKVAPGYDPSLAAPRMDAVEAQLIADGVPKSRLARASETTDGINITHDASGAQRVEIRLVDRPAGAAP